MLLLTDDDLYWHLCAFLSSFSPTSVDTSSPSCTTFRWMAVTLPNSRSWPFIVRRHHEWNFDWHIIDAIFKCKRINWNVWVTCVSRFLNSWKLFAGMTTTSPEILVSKYCREIWANGELHGWTTDIIVFFTSAVLLSDTLPQPKGNPLSSWSIKNWNEIQFQFIHHFFSLTTLSNRSFTPPPILAILFIELSPSCRLFWTIRDWEIYCWQQQYHSNAIIATYWSKGGENVKFFYQNSISRK